MKCASANTGRVVSQQNAMANSSGIFVGRLIRVLAGTFREPQMDASGGRAGDLLKADGFCRGAGDHHKGEQAAEDSGKHAGPEALAVGTLSGLLI